MKIKMTNICERQVSESFPGEFRFSLQPGESITVDPHIAELVKQARGIRGSLDLEFVEIAEDLEVVKAVEEFEEEEKETFLPVEVDAEEKPQPTLFSLLNKE